MYPFARYLSVSRRARRGGPREPFETHLSRHRCWPWDIDPWGELNNGRTLTLYDLGRIPMVSAFGMGGVLRQHQWAMAAAGVSVRYRRRIRVFQRFTMMSRMIGWDDRFFYVEQSMWKGAECANHMLMRTAVSSSAGIVPPVTVLAELGLSTEAPSLPGWVNAWIEAEALRPWPPEMRPATTTPADGAADAGILHS